MERYVEIDVKVKLRVPSISKSGAVHKILDQLSDLDGSYTYSVDVAEIPNPLEDKAVSIRTQYRLGSLEKIQAIKDIRNLFLNTADERNTLKGAKDYIEG